MLASSIIYQTFPPNFGVKVCQPATNFFTRTARFMYALSIGILPQLRGKPSGTDDRICEIAKYSLYAATTLWQVKKILP